MNQSLKTIQDLLQQNKQLTELEREALLKAVTDADKQWNITEFKLDRTEKVKKTTAILLEETIEELEQKRKVVEAQNRELEIEAALERVRSKTMTMQQSEELANVISLMCREILGLGITHEQMETCYIVTFEDHNPTGEIYLSTSGGDLIPYSFRIAYNEDHLFKQIFAAWQNGDPFFVGHLEGEELNKHFAYLFSHIPESIKEMRSVDLSVLPSETFTHALYFSQGYLAIVTRKPVPEYHQLFKRFGSALQQAYTRFLDLQKAEAQAREAQIQLALERVRARTMAMQRSDELMEAANLLFQQVQSLGIPVWTCGYNIWETGEKSCIGWMSTRGAIQPSFRIPLTENPSFIRMYESRLKGESFFAEEVSGEALADHYRYMFSLPDFKKIATEQLKDGFTLPTSQVHNVFNFKQGNLIFISTEPVPEAWHIFKRFGKVFEQTYTRFLDLQKAEAQAREAEIQLALERVRARTMAMQRSDELSETAYILFQQFRQLGDMPIQITIGIFNEEENTIEFRITGFDGSGSQIDRAFNMSIDEATLLKKFYETWKEQKPSATIELAGQELLDWVSYRNSVAGNFFSTTEKISLHDRRFVSAAFFAKGLISFSKPEPIGSETIHILERFASVFDQTYTRFLDLQKAEASAREAHIEAALEKVRSSTMAMHKSEDLAKTAVVLFAQLNALGNTPDRISIGIIHEPEGVADMWLTDQSGNEIDSRFILNLNEKTTVQRLVRGWKAGLKSMIVDLTGEELNTWLNYVRKIGLIVKDEHFKNRRVHNVAFFSHGWLNISALEPLSPDMINILERFAAVYSLTYRRFLDLQTAEANAKEAIKQAALDRIRADIASMRTVSDLDRITPLIWNELTILGVSFIRCGVFIMDDKQELIHTFLSTPEGTAIAAFHIPYNTPGNIAQVLSHWNNKENYIDHWNESDFAEFAEILTKQGGSALAAQYLKTIPHSGFYLHFLPFLQGMLYVGNTSQLDNEEIRLIQSVADAFSTAYARYEDFNKLEAAKRQVEKTLVDLKQAQLQLVQSEKMASLGELTAGIAHEIQNPLNFVNNFSEVNNELISELVDEVDKGNLDEVKAIAIDIKGNEEKINHHGKRADAIVKGMLQHSRTSSGQKEPIDINTLADEYLRLAYHGLRAKDKSFNTKIETDFDNNIGIINVVPQDIGRVLLNLFTNAFYAVSKPSNSLKGEQDKPLVSVTTRKISSPLGAGGVEIRVADNGSGIPQNIVDKIFQPFFTTKPTGQGTGLGLSLAYDIIKAHGGEIKVETKEGEGSEFVIQLPIA